MSEREFNNRDTERLWKYPDVADFLNLAEVTVRKKVAAGDIPCVRFGRAVRFDPDDIRAYVEEQKVASAAEGVA